MSSVSASSAKVVPIVSASVSAVASTANPPPAAELKHPRSFRVKSSCRGDQLKYETVSTTCACELPSRYNSRSKFEPCDFQESDEALVKRYLVPSVTVNPASLSPGKSAQIQWVFENTAPHDLAVMLDESAHSEIKILEADGKAAKIEVDPKCQEVSMLGMAEFAMIVLPPGGKLLANESWSANYFKRAANKGDMGCHTTKGSPLLRGDYTLRTSSYRVWAFRDKPFDARVTVQ